MGSDIAQRLWAQSIGTCVCAECSCNVPVTSSRPTCLACACLCVRTQTPKMPTLTPQQKEEGKEP